MSTTLSLDGSTLTIPTANDTSWHTNLNNTLSSIVSRLDTTAPMLNVKAYGAVGNGSTDDTTAIQAAINAAANNNGGIVFLPRAQYLFTTLTLDATKAVWLVGEGWGHNSSGAGGSVLKHSGTGNGIVIGDTSADRTCDIRLMGFRMQGTGSDADGIRVLRTHHVLVDGVRIYGWGGDGIELDRSYACQFVNNYINNNSGCGFKANGQNAFTILERNSFLSNAQKGVFFTAGDADGTRIFKNDFSGNAVGLQFDVGSSGAQSAGVMVVGNYAESQTGANYKFGTDAGSLFLDGLTFAGNNINAGTIGASTNTVEFDRCRGVNCSGNYFGEANVSTTTNTIGFIFDAANKLAGSSTFTNNGIARFDQSNATKTRIGGATPTIEVTPAGWTEKHRIGTPYSGGVLEVGNNLAGVNDTTANLDNTGGGATGTLTRLSPAKIEHFSATNGSNPRTLVRLAIHSLATGAETSGTATLSSGQVTVSTTSVLTGSKILVSRNTSAGTALGELMTKDADITNATSFIIKSQKADNSGIETNDTSTVNWWILR